MDQAIVYLTPVVGLDGRYEMEYSDINILEQAVQWKEGGDQRRVTLLALGPREMKSALREGLAMGADRGQLLLEEEEVWDCGLQARRLEAAIRQLGPFTLLCAGGGGADPQRETAAVLAAEGLGLPQITQIVDFHQEENQFAVRRKTEEGSQELLVPCPCLLSNCWRKQTWSGASFMDIQEAMEKELCFTEEAAENPQRGEAIGPQLLAAFRERRRRSQLKVAYGQGDQPFFQEIQNKLILYYQERK